MKASLDAILHQPQAEYLESLTPAPDPLLGEIESYAAEHRHPIADREVGHFMRLLLRIHQPRHLLEIGTNIGYSVVVMGRECPNAHLETIELDGGILGVAREFVSRAALTARVSFHQGAALEVLPRLDGPFDFVFIDCVKTEYEQYLDLVIPKMSRGGLILCDNLLWGGQVAEGAKSASQTDSTLALKKFNERIMTDSRLLSIVLPLGDGVGVSIVL